MAIRTLITRGYGNGTFNGTIALVVTRGYAIGEAVAVIVSEALTADNRDFALVARTRDFDLTADDRDFTLTARS